MRALRWLPALAVPLAGCTPRLVVDVVAFQWNWQFDYPDSGVRVTGVKGRPAELVPPVASPCTRSPSGSA